MTALNFKTIVIGLASLLVVSVAHGKCYPGLDCPEDLPNANNAPSQPVPAPSTSQQEPEPAAAPPESTADEPQPVGGLSAGKYPKNQMMRLKNHPH